MVSLPIDEQIDLENRIFLSAPPQKYLTPEGTKYLRDKWFEMLFQDNVTKTWVSVTL